MTAAPNAQASKEYYDDIPATDVEWIAGYPTPPAPPVRPFFAIKKIFELIANKEDTSLVFDIVSSLSGKAGRNMFSRFVSTPYGKRVLSEPVQLEKILSDREALRALPAGSVGRVYLDFMEGENLTPDGLIDAAAEAGIDFRDDSDFEDFRRMFLHINVSHDLWHVLTGYSRDALGEVCNLVYTYAQTKNRGFLLIVFIGAIAQKLEQPKAKIISALMEARRNAKATKWVLEVDVEQLLTMPLAEARKMLVLGPTPVYNSVPEEIKKSLLQPKSPVANGQPAATVHPAE